MSIIITCVKKIFKVEFQNRKKKKKTYFSHQIINQLEMDRSITPDWMMSNEWSRMPTPTPSKQPKSPISLIDYELTEDDIAYFKKNGYWLTPKPVICIELFLLLFFFLLFVSKM